jgi:hypothetical protein
MKEIEETSVAEEVASVTAPSHPDIVKTEMTFDEMVAAYSIWDQTIGCDNCNSAWWAENATEDPTMFHKNGCPLKGRRDVAMHHMNVDYIEKHIGRRIGYPES